MFLHNTWCLASGNAEKHRSIADQLDALTDASVQLYMSRAKNLTEESLREMMNKETMLAPDTCLEYGFCDFVGNVSQKEDSDEKESEEDTDEKETEEEDTDEKGTEEEPGGKKTEEEDLEKKQLKEQLYQQKQINTMLINIKKKSVKSTFAAALQQLSNK